MRNSSGLGWSNKLEFWRCTWKYTGKVRSSLSSYHHLHARHRRRLQSTTSSYASSSRYHHHCWWHYCMLAPNPAHVKSQQKCEIVLGLVAQGASTQRPRRYDQTSPCFGQGGISCTCSGSVPFSKSSACGQESCTRLEEGVQGSHRKKRCCHKRLRSTELGFICSGGNV